jgi:hypothetical protein
MTVTLTTTETNRTDVDGPWLIDVFHEQPLRPATPAEVDGREPGDEFTATVERTVYVDVLAPHERDAYGPVYFIDPPSPARRLGWWVADNAAPFAAWVVAAVLAFTVFREPVQNIAADLAGIGLAFFRLPPAVQVATAAVYFVISTALAEVWAWQNEGDR